MINLPAGTPVERGIAVKSFNVKQTFDNIENAKMSGYMALMVDGMGGLEEGVIVFKDGALIGAVYEYLKYDQLIFSAEALKRFFNAANAEYGVLDVFSLTPKQADLILSFAGQAKFPTDFTKESLLKLLSEAVSFTNAFAERDIQVKGHEIESREEVLKRYSLADLVTGKTK